MLAAVSIITGGEASECGTLVTDREIVCDSNTYETEDGDIVYNPVGTGRATLTLRGITVAPLEHAGATSGVRGAVQVRAKGDVELTLEDGVTITAPGELSTGPTTSGLSMAGTLVKVEQIGVGGDHNRLGRRHHDIGRL